MAFQLFVESVITESHRVFTQCDTLKSYWIFFLALSQKVQKVKSLACIVLHNKRGGVVGERADILRQLRVWELSEV